MLAPCAAGGLIDEALARSIDCRVVAGAANNPLTDRAVARTLMQRDIVYVPGLPRQLRRPDPRVARVVRTARAAARTT